MEKAGYAESMNPYELLKSDAVIERMRLLDAGGDVMVSKARRFNILSKIMNNMASKDGDRIKAIMEINKMTDGYTAVRTANEHTVKGSPLMERPIIFQYTPIRDLDEEE